jgi:hypothetical protein
VTGWAGRVTRRRQPGCRRRCPGRLSLRAVGACSAVPDLGVTAGRRARLWHAVFRRNGETVVQVLDSALLGRNRQGHGRRRRGGSRRGHPGRPAGQRRCGLLDVHGSQRRRGTAVAGQARRGSPPADPADADQSQLGLSRAFASAMPQRHAERPGRKLPATLADTENPSRSRKHRAQPSRDRATAPRPRTARNPVTPPPTPPHPMHPRTRAAGEWPSRTTARPLPAPRKQWERSQRRAGDRGGVVPSVAPAAPQSCRRPAGRGGCGGVAPSVAPAAPQSRGQPPAARSLTPPAPPPRADRHRTAPTPQ